MNVKEALTAILSKSLSAEQVYSQVSPQLKEEIEISLAYIGELYKTNDESYFQTISKEEVFKFDSNGQWKMEKAGSIDYAKMNAPKPKMESPSIDYAKMNSVQKKPEGPAMDYSQPKPDYKSIEEKAPSIDYKQMNDPANQKAAWKQKSTPATQKEAWMKVNRQRNEMAARGLKKNEGVLLDEEVKDKSRMIAKDDMLAAAGSLAQSEKEPHHDDPQHEAKEKKKAKKIKAEAQKLLDMHKK
jgi:hypothetical protein